MKKTFSMAGIGVGIAIMILGLVLAFSKTVSYSGEVPLDYSFGADFYTEQYGATRDAAINVNRLGNVVEDGFNIFTRFTGLFITFSGAATVCYFGVKLSETSVVTTEETRTGVEKAEETPSV